MQSVIAAVFKNESEGFQAITELKKQPLDDKTFVFQMVLVKRGAQGIEICDRFDSEVLTSSDTVIGGLMGGFLGILGGPIGVLLGGAYGALIGSVVDADDALDNASILEEIAKKLNDGEVAIIGLTSEEDESVIDAKLAKFKVTVLRYDAEAVAEEVDKAQELEDAMARQARSELRKKKMAEGKEKVKEWFKSEEDKYEEAAEEKAEVAFEKTPVGPSTDENYD